MENWQMAVVTGVIAVILAPLIFGGWTMLLPTSQIGAFAVVLSIAFLFGLATIISFVTLKYVSFINDRLPPKIIIILVIAFVSNLIISYIGTVR